MMLTVNLVSRQNQTQKLNTHTINPHNELPLKLMNALGKLCKELVYLLISSTNHFNHSNVPVAITRMHGRNVGMDADTCKNTRRKQAQTLCTHADVDIPTLARSHLTMGISARLCWHLWNWFPMAARSIYCHKHWRSCSHIMLTQNTITSGRLHCSCGTLREKKNRQGLEDGRWDATHHLGDSTLTSFCH